MTITPHPSASAPVAHPSPAVGVVQRSRRDDIASIPTAVHSEWIKATSLRSNVTILVLTPVIGVALSWIMATFVKIDPDTDLPFTVGETFIFSTWLTAVLAAILGTLTFTSEVQHGTMATAVAAQPVRWVTVASKTTVAASCGLAMGILGMIGGLSGAILGGLAKGDTSAMASTALWGLVLTTLAPVLGLGVGMILRHSAAAVSTLLVWAFVLENIARNLVPVSTTRYLPFSAASGVLGLTTPNDTPESLAAALTPFQNAVLFGGYAFALLAIGTTLFSRRDAD
jgi:ABC-type transport system involved in multi-copper enzyme maturation permease subunit